MTTYNEVLGAQRSRRTVIAFSASVLLMVSACSGGEVTVEQVERQVQLDADGRVVDSSSNSTTFTEDDAPGAAPTEVPGVEPLDDALAAEGAAAVDCGDGAQQVELNGGVANTTTAAGTAVEVTLLGSARLDDFDDDGLDDLAAAYHCDGDEAPVALSLSFWHNSKSGPTQSAVSVEPIGPDATVAIPRAPGDAQVGLTVLGPQRQTERLVIAEIDSGRLRLVSDEPPEDSGGVETLPISEFPDRLDLSAAGLGPLRLGATEDQLTEALALVVPQVQNPPVPPCFGTIDRVIEAEGIYFGLNRNRLRAIWVTGPTLTAADRTVPLAAVLESEQARRVAVGEVIDASSPPDGLEVLRFGEDWVSFDSTTVGSNVSVAAEAASPGGPSRRVTGFGIADRACLVDDFTPQPEEG